MNRLAFSWCLLLLLFGMTNLNAQTSSKGVLRINHPGSASQGLVDITGEWQFFYGKHLTSHEMNSMNPVVKQYVRIPSNWKKPPTGNKACPVFGIATYYRRIILPPNPKKEVQKYGFRVGNITSAYKLWVNDALVMEAGKATRDKNGFRPIYFPQTETFSTQADTLEIVLQVSNFFDLNYAGVSEKIYFGSEEAVEKYTFDKYSIAIFMLSVFLLLSIFQMLMCLVRKEDRSHRMIALLSAIFFLKMLLDGDVVLFHYVPQIGFLFAYRLWLCSFLSIAVVFQLIRLAFPEDMNKWVFRVVVGFFLVAALGFLILNVQFLMSIIFYIIYVAFASVLYLFYVQIKAVRNRRKYSVVHLVSFTVMILLLLNDLIYVTNQETVGYLSQLGACFYVISQSIVASLKFAKAHRESIRLSRELEHTNQNLERKVLARTQELEKANAKLAGLNKQKDFLISSISHDLRNSFNIMINYSKILHDMTEDEQHEFTGLLYETSVKSYETLENILSWAKLMILEKPEIAVIPHLSDQIEKSIRFFSEQMKDKAITTTVKIDNGFLFRCNEGHLDTILRNLLSNAIKFSRPGSNVAFWNTLEEGWVHITIHDEGIGLPKEIAETIFDTTREKKRKGTQGEQGTGIGLLIVKELVENNHGTIRCTSTQGQGTDFIVSFPAYRE